MEQQLPKSQVHKPSPLAEDELFNVAPILLITMPISFCINFPAVITSSFCHDYWLENRLTIY